MRCHAAMLDSSFVERNVWIESRTTVFLNKSWIYTNCCVVLRWFYLLFIYNVLICKHNIIYFGSPNLETSLFLASGYAFPTLKCYSIFEFVRSFITKLFYSDVCIVSIYIRYYFHNNTGTKPHNYLLNELNYVTE